MMKMMVLITMALSTELTTIVITTMMSMMLGNRDGDGDNNR